ncbi:hypothetical protein NIES2101_10265 [Calothrix sp. HK-06]|nr:hypothetical protein NIES2101_10265 [Calothrix sp. HK-06]
MSSGKYEKFTGQALLEKLKTISHLSHSERAKQCGYYKIVSIPSERRQKIEYHLSEFYDEIIEAKKQERQLQGKQNQPNPFDAVLGNELSPPVAGMVLGGIDGIKNRLNSTDIETRVAALPEALKHGASGVDLVIAALKDPSSKVRSSAYELLQVRKLDKKSVEAVSKFDKLLLLTRLQDWKTKDYNHKAGLKDLTKTAYAIKSLEQFKLLLQDTQVSQLQALVFKITNGEDYNQQFSYAVDILFDACTYLTNLKALCIGDGSKVIPLGDISALLQAYPKLEILQISNGFKLNFSPTRHNYLKTLICNASDLDTKTIQQIYKLELPELEYIDIGFGDYRGEKPNTPVIAPILSTSFFPKLRYLGIRNGEDYNKLASAIVRSPLVNRLLVLDLSDGTLGDKGAEVLFNCPAINRLYTLNVSRNYLSSNIVKQLSKLKCHVIAQSQKYYRYSATYE